MYRPIGHLFHPKLCGGGRFVIRGRQIVMETPLGKFSSRNNRVISYTGCQYLANRVRTSTWFRSFDFGFRLFVWEFYQVLQRQGGDHSEATILVSINLYRGHYFQPTHFKEEIQLNFVKILSNQPDNSFCLKFNGNDSNVCIQFQRSSSSFLRYRSLWSFEIFCLGFFF